MVTLGLLCVFLTLILGIMVLMALGARGIAEDKRNESEQAAKQAESDKDKQ
ncbi:MAG: hypothetical protein KA368_05070 [Acidobacteria bacterium]|nr:hypothetical protein [Acidobacteriota bacterium]